MWNVNGDWHGFEVVVNSEALTSHIQACFEESDVISQLTIVVPLKGTKERLEKALKADPDVAPHMSRIGFELVETYLLKELWP